MPALRRVWEACVPHPDVFSRDIDPGLFAISLFQVVKGSADPDYSDTSRFWAKTYLTESLRSLLERVLGRLSLSRELGVPVITVQTPFGGGKTHTLTALYHLASHPDESTEALRPVLERLQLSRVPQPVRVAVLDGAALNPREGREVNGLRLRTMWGELAYQLGGSELYGVLKGDDEEKTSPGAERLIRVLEAARPCVVLIDEFVTYLLGAKAVRVGDSNLMEQTGKFLQELTTAVQGVAGCVLVGSLPVSSLEVPAESEEAAQRLFEYASKVMGRVDLVETTVLPQEVPEILRRRMFRSVGEDRNRKRVADAYWDYYREYPQFFPDRMRHPDYRERMRACYPFHPELIDLLYDRWGPHPKFQRTRGALALLALVLRRLWHQQPGSAYLIQPYHVDLSDPSIRSKGITYLLGEAYESVINGDILDRAGQIDRELGGDYDRERLARGAATVAMLYTVSGAKERGATEEQIRAALLRPDLNPALVAQVLSELRERLWFLWYRDRYYEFRPRPNLVKVRLDFETAVTQQDIADALRQKMDVLVGQGRSALQPVVWPASPTSVPDSDRPTLVVLPLEARDSSDAERWMAAAIASFGDVPRSHRNSLIFLAPVSADEARLKAKARSLVALKAIRSSSQWRNMDDEDRAQLQQQLTRADEELTELLRQAYSGLYRPSSEGVERLTFVPGERRATLLQAVESTLRGQGLLSDVLDQQYITDRLLRGGNASLSEIETKLFGAPGSEVMLVGGRQALQESILEAARKGALTLIKDGKPVEPEQLRPEVLSGSTQVMLTADVSLPPEEAPVLKKHRCLVIRTSPNMLYPLLQAAQMLRAIRGRIELKVFDEQEGEGLGQVRDQLEKLLSDYQVGYEWLDDRQEQA